jgi:hypothetical protein
MTNVATRKNDTMASAFTSASSTFVLVDAPLSWSGPYTK